MMEKILPNVNQTSDAIPKEKLARLSELPSLPALFLEVLQQINDNQYTTVLAEKISNDPPLVARILRIANSSFYGRSREIGTVHEAIMLLGVSRVRDLLLAVCFSKMIPAQNKNFNYTLFWHHSMAVAECSRQLANHAGINPELAFTAGLLHDIGQLIIVVFFPEEANKMLTDGKLPSAYEEKHLLGFDHLQMGGQAALYWKFPLAIQETIEKHEIPPAPDAANSLSSIIYIANLLIQVAENNQTMVANEFENLPAVLNLLPISDEKTALYVDKAQQFADQIVAIL
ncbi:MAG: HDOD domain-containing protein [Methylococcaceae bacterium]